MRRFSVTSIVLYATLTGCSGTQSASDAGGAVARSGEPSLVGTWRLVTMYEPVDTPHEVKLLFFIRFYADGSAASWPTPDEPVSRGKYVFVNGRLSLPDVPGKSVEVHVTAEEMSYFTNEAGCKYRRVTPDLTPGEFPH